MRRGRRAVPALLAVAAVALVVPPSAQAAFPGDNGKLAFALTSFPDGRPSLDIWTVRPPSTQFERLTSDPLPETAPAWSANGRWIVFSRGPHTCCGAGGDLWVAREDGTQERRLTDGPPHDTSPAWSPDGKQIVFASSRNDPTPESFTDYDLFVIKVDGSGLRLLVGQPGRTEEAPTWSPDGGDIAFAARCAHSCPPGNPPGIVTVAPDGTAERPVTSPEELIAIQPEWSPDGTLLAYSDGTRLLTIKPDGTGRTALPAPHQRTSPAWSPDGTRIAFSGAAPGDFFGHMNLDGSDVVALGGPVFGGLTWQPLGPRREDFKNGPAFCRAEREFLGEEEFAAQYRNFGGCVSRKG